MHAESNLKYTSILFLPLWGKKYVLHSKCICICHCHSLWSCFEEKECNWFSPVQSSPVVQSTDCRQPITICMATFICTICMLQYACYNTICMLQYPWKHAYTHGTICMSTCHMLQYNYTCQHASYTYYSVYNISIIIQLMSIYTLQYAMFNYRIPACMSTCISYAFLYTCQHVVLQATPLHSKKSLTTVPVEFNYVSLFTPTISCSAYQHANPWHHVVCMV